MLAKTALLCSCAPSDLVGIEEREIAIPFNFECADILNMWEMEREFEREKRQIELLGGSVTSQLGIPEEPRNKVQRW